MKELKELYGKLISGLKEDHDLWVKSNHKMRSIEAAKRKIEAEDDDPAMEVLNKAYQKEQSWNDNATKRMYARKDLIREIEVFASEHGEDWNGTYEVFGY